MSSLRNAVSRRNHKERSQPLERQKFGLLEKKKDYILRARDFHRKQDYLKKLREKATDRNPDEFYFGMMTEKTRKGVVVKDRGNTTLSEDALKVLRTQDAGYVRTMRQIESKKIERLEGELHVLDDETPDAHKGRKRKHTVFVNEESDAKAFDAASHFDTHPSLVSRSSNRPRLDQLESVAFAPSNVEMDERKVQREREARLRELDARTQRGDMLRKLEKETVLQRNLQGKGARKKIGVDKDGTAVYKWKQERKR